MGKGYVGSSYGRLPRRVTDASRIGPRHCASCQIALTLAIGAAAILVQPVHAQTRWLGGVSTDWNDDGNWDNNAPDGSNGDILIKPGSSFDPNYSAGSLDTTNSVYVGAESSSNAELTVSGGFLITGQHIVAPDGGTSANAVNLSNGVIGSKYWFIVGRNGGNGTFNMTGGTVNSSTRFDETILGNTAGSVGTLNIDGGIFNVGGDGSERQTGDDAELWVGENGRGVVHQSAGQMNSRSYLVLGRNNGASGEYNLSGGVVNAATVSGFPVLGSFGGSQGTLNVSGTGDFNAGYIRIGEAGAGTLTVTGGTVDINGVTDVGFGGNNTTAQNGSVTVSGGVLNSEGDLRLHFAGGASAQAKLTVDGGTVNVGSNATRWMIVGQYDFGSSTVNVDSGNLNLNANSALRFSTGDGGTGSANGNIGTNVVNLNGGAITSYSDNATTADGAGVVDLSRNGGGSINNTFNLNGGTLTIREVITGRNDGTAAFNFNGGTLKATGDTANFVALGGADQTANVQAGGAVIDSNNHAVTIPQPLLDGGGGGGLTKLGAGTLVLSGANTYTGDTSVSGGILIIGGSVAGNANVASGATLGGGGSVGGTLTLAGGGTVAPGTSPGTLTVGGLSVDSGSFLSFELAGDDQTVGGGVNDLIVVNGSVTLDGTLHVTETGGSFATNAQAGDTWQMMSYSGSLTDNGLDLGSMPTLSAGLFFSVDTTTAGVVNLTVNAIPEASAFLFGGVACLATGWGYVRRRRKG